MGFFDHSSRKSKVQNKGHSEDLIKTAVFFFLLLINSLVAFSFTHCWLGYFISWLGLGTETSQ